MPLSGYFLPPSGKSLILLVVVSVKTAARSEVATVWCPKYCAAPARSRQGASPQCVGRAQRRLDRSGSVFLQARRRHVLGASWFYAATQLDAPSPEAKFAVESPLAQATAGSTCSAQSRRSGAGAACAGLPAFCSAENTFDARIERGARSSLGNNILGMLRK